jgi:hypothetical protein
MNLSPTKQPSGFVPIAMSLAALAAVVAHIALVGTAPQPDEGTAAHIWQLLMAGQIPVIAFYAIKWLPRTPRAATQTIAMQIVAALGAMAPVYWLGW